MADALRANGTITANAGAVPISPNGRGCVAIELTGTWVANLDIKSLVDGTEENAKIYNAAGAAVGLPLTTNQIVYAYAAGREQIIVRANPWTSGTATVVMNATDGVPFVASAGGGGGGGAVTVTTPGDFVDGWDATQGAKADTAATTDTGTFSVVSFWKRLLSRLTTLLPQSGGRLSVDGSGVTQPVSGTVTITPSGTQTVSGTVTTTPSGTQTVSGTVTANAGTGTLAVSAAALPLPTGAAADASISTTNTEIGGLTETAPATDTASSGLNGRMQRVAQRMTSLIALLPSALISNRLDVNLGAAPATVTVQGGAATGAAVPANPNYSGGKDTAGNVQPFRLGVDGNLNPGLVSTANSSTATLTSGSVFTGTSEDVSSYAAVTVIVTSDVASASNGVSLQQSNDGTNWDYKQVTTYGAQPGAQVVSTSLYGKFFRVVYTNGGTNQASFRLQTIYRTVAVLPTLTAGTVASGNNFVQPVGVVGGMDSGSTVKVFTFDAGNDARSSGLTQLHVMAHQYAFSGSTDDRLRMNVNAAVRASTGVTVQTVNTDITTYNAAAFLYHANVTNYNGGTLTVKLQWKDANGLFVDIPGATTGGLTSGADIILAVGPTVWPANTATSFYVNYRLPRLIRVVETIATATITFSAAYDLPAS